MRKKAEKRPAEVGHMLEAGGLDCIREVGELGEDVAVWLAWTGARRCQPLNHGLISTAATIRHSFKAATACALSNFMKIN
jgi:hypothetical protein